MSAQILVFAIASSAAFVGLALLGEAWRALHNAKRLRYRYRIYALRDELIRLGANGDIDPASKAFKNTLASINEILHLNEWIGMEFFRLAQETVSNEDQAERMQVEIDELPVYQQESLSKMHRMIGSAIIDLMCHNSRIVRMIIWTRRLEMNGVPSASNVHASNVANGFMRTAVDSPLLAAS